MGSVFNGDNADDVLTPFFKHLFKDFFVSSNKDKKVAKTLPV
jgi:hypothetical protein